MGTPSPPASTPDPHGSGVTQSLNDKGEISREPSLVVLGAPGSDPQIGREWEGMSSSQERGE